MCSSVVERCPDKTEVEGSIPSTRTRREPFLFMKNKEKTESIWKNAYMKVFIEVSGWIVIPVLISAFIGNFLDNKFDTAPWILAIALILSFVLSMISIVKIAKKYEKDFDKNNKDGNK